MSTSTLPEGLSPAEIDAVVSERVAAGEDLYRLDEGALAELDADVVLTQDLCAVCAVDLERVDDALAYLGCTARVLTLDPQSLDEILTSVLDVGHALDAELHARGQSSTQLRTRLGRARHESLRGADARSVLVLEWTDPPFCAGHWVPDLVAAGGGTAVLATPGRDSHRITWTRSVRQQPTWCWSPRAATTSSRPRASPSSSSPTTGFLRAPRCGRSMPTATSSGPGPVSSTAPRPWRRSCIPRSSALRRPTGRDESTMAEDRMIELEGWQGPWSDDDPDANFKADVALYSHVDPLTTIRTRLPAALDVPVGALCHYVLAKWATQGSGGLLELGPTIDATPRSDLRRCRARRHRRGTLGGVPTAAGPHLVAPVPVGPSGGLRAVAHDRSLCEAGHTGPRPAQTRLRVPKCPGVATGSVEACPL